MQGKMNSQVKPDKKSASADASGRRVVANAACRMTEAASRHGVLRGNCLSKSMVLWRLLRRHGLKATLHVGGQKTSASFEAHAWVELEGRILNDSDGIRESFVPFEDH
jgi:hypothetical protein